PAAPRHLDAAPLWREDLHLVGPADAGLSLSAPVSLADLARFPIILPSAGHGLRGLLEHYAARHDVALRVEIEADAMRIQKDLTARGLGFTALPFAAVKPEVEASNLSAAPIVDPAVPHRVIRAFPGDRPVSRAARLLGDRMTVVVRRMIAAGAWPGLIPESPDLTPD
ncbi:MAG: LysR substrate-binding domain-containing protein, partial [Gammaproteobacteria bacterium]